MPDYMDFKIGDRVDIFIGRGDLLKTQIEDMLPGGELVISPPQHRGIPISLHANQDLEVYFYNTNGRYVLDARVGKITREGDLTLFTLVPRGELRRQQRRGSFRLDTIRDVRFRPLAEGPINPDSAAEVKNAELARTENISENGLSLLTSTRHEQGERLHMLLYLEFPAENSAPLEVVGELVQVNYDMNKERYTLGVRFVNNDEVFDKIRRFVVSEQQKTIRQRKWVVDADE